MSLVSFAYVVLKLIFTMYPRVVVPYGRARVVRTSALVLVSLVFILTLRFRYTHPSRRSIYKYTEGKTSGPWREEWSHPFGKASSRSKAHNDGGDNNTTSSSNTDELKNYMLSLAQKYHLTSEVPFVARRIRPEYASVGGKKQNPQQDRSTGHGQRPCLIEVKSPLLSPHNLVRARLANPHRLSLSAADGVVSLPMGAAGHRITTPDKVDASSVLFGVATTYARLMYADRALLRDWARWLTDGRERSNGAGLVVTLHGASEKEVGIVREALLRAGVDARVFSSSSRGGREDEGGRYAMLMKQMMRERVGGGGNTSPRGGKGTQKKQKKREYFAVIDDDVFFPSMGRLMQTLHAQFDPSKPYYIGVPSERSDWVVETDDDGTRTKVTYGGGAVFLTAPMLDIVGQLLCLQDSHSTNSHNSTPIDTSSWDMLLYKCITHNANPKAPLHILPGLYDPSTSTLDLTYSLRNKDQKVITSGYGSSTLQPLALHRYRNYHRLEAAKGHLVTSACGEECFLQRFLFAGDGWVLVNGYTLTKYPPGWEVVAPLPQKQPAPQPNPKPKPLSRKQKQKQKQTPIPKTHDLEDGYKGEDSADKENPLSINPQLILSSPSSPPANNPSSKKTIAYKPRRRTFHLLDAQIRPNGEIWQAYVNRKGGPAVNAVTGDMVNGPGDVARHNEEERADIDSVVLLSWEAWRDEGHWEEV